MVANAIISTKFFENLCLIVIFINSMVMMIEDPADKDPAPIFADVDKIFLVLYSLEMIFKILGYGLIISDKAYLRDPWNILDFTIVISGYLTLITDQIKAADEKDQVSKGGKQEGAAIDLTGLRVFRVMRPLKSISSIKGLKVLM